jgi:glyoxylate utilization-related uncharacterized protein
MSADPFVRRVVTVAPGDRRPYDPDEWRDAIVYVEDGEVDLECRGGGFARFSRGDVLWLTGLPLLALHNRGSEPARLVAVSRRSIPLRAAALPPCSGRARAEPTSVCPRAGPPAGRAR